jgi:Asp/Glu/hydantoin racemase
MTENMRHPHILAMIHTVPDIMARLTALVGVHLPDWHAFNMLDESLLGNTIREGSLSPGTMRRLATHVWSAVDAGASAILVTCSSLGPAVDAALPLCTVPLFRIDEGMAIEALRHGRRIGVLATLGTTLEPTARLIERHASTSWRKVLITSRLCEGAFDDLRNGNKAAHDAIVRACLADLAGSVDVIVLAQASMANAVDAMAEVPAPVLTSPELGVLHMSAVLKTGGQARQGLELGSGRRLTTSD